MTLHIDTIAYTNRLRHLPPTHKVMFGGVLLLLTYCTHAPLQLLILAWVSLWTVGYAGVAIVTYLRLLTITVGFWLTSLPALVVNVVTQAQVDTLQADLWQSWTVGDYVVYLSHQGLAQAAELGVRAIAATACIYFVMLTVPFTEILELLRRLGCPALLTDLLMLMYRFIFVLLRTANELWIAQQSRNGYRTHQLGLQSLSLLISQLLRRTLENYQQVSLTLRSRGFTGEFRVCHSRQYAPSQRYSFEAVVGCIVLIVLAGWQYAAGL